MVDVRIYPKLRKGRVLIGGRFGCLKGTPTLNITKGCLFRCTYCYAQGYPQAPKEGEVHLYVNLPGLLEEELSERRPLSSWVILNTASDCFQSHPDILKTTYEIFAILLAHGLGISFLTKGTIPKMFIDLFARFPGKILAQVGLVSLSETYRRSYEPFAPPAKDRLETVRQLMGIGITPEVRVDPIIPFITDREDEMVPLFERLVKLGVKRVTLSYLHLRPALEHQLKKELPPLYWKILESCFRAGGWSVVGSFSKVKLLPASLRQKGYQRIRGLAQRFGIESLVCQCKNPDLKGDLCSSGRIRITPTKRDLQRLPLFGC